MKRFVSRLFYCQGTDDVVSIFYCAIGGGVWMVEVLTHNGQWNFTALYPTYEDAVDVELSQSAVLLSEEVLR